MGFVIYEQLPVRQINDAGLALVKRFEGLKLDAYQDVAGIWTIGYGHIHDVVPGQHIVEEVALQFLLDDLMIAESAVVAAIANDNQFAAMVSLCFNIGILNFRQSTVWYKHRRKDYQEAADAFLMWDKAHVQGVLRSVPGLRARRAAERALYLQPDGVAT